MSIGSADIQKVIKAAWDTASLDDKFTDLGGSTPVLNYGEATPEQDQPYCVWDYASPDVETRMTGGSATLNREIRNGSLKFDVHAKPIDGESRGSSEIAAYLIEEIMKVFGGHPETNPTAEYALAAGNFLNMQYTRDYCVRSGDNNNYQWTLEYQVTVDVPVAL